MIKRHEAWFLAIGTGVSQGITEIIEHRLRHAAHIGEEHGIAICLVALCWASYRLLSLAERKDKDK